MCRLDSAAVGLPTYLQLSLLDKQPTAFQYSDGSLPRTRRPSPSRSSRSSAARPPCAHPSASCALPVCGQPPRAPNVPLARPAHLHRLVPVPLRAPASLPAPSARSGTGWPAGVGRGSRRKQNHSAGRCRRRCRCRCVCQPAEVRRAHTVERAAQERRGPGCAGKPKQMLYVMCSRVCKVHSNMIVC